MQFIVSNLAGMSKEDKEAAEKLGMELERERAHLGEECTGDDVEREAEWCQETQSSVLDAKAKKIRICARSKRWLNGVIKERRRALGREKRRGGRSEAAARAKAELQKSIWQSKSWMWNDYVQNLTGGEVWRVAKFTNPWVGATMEVLTDREGKQANTIAEKEEMLSGESFPLNDGDQYYEQHPAGQAHERITDQSVERALFSQSVKKAPGPHKLSFGAIRLLWKWDKMRIVELTKAAVRTGRHPAVWKRASGVVIWKPGKEDYTKLKSYRTISLLSCMGKVVEKVVAELLSDEAERRALPSDGQFGSRKKRSAIDAAAITVDRAHAVWKEDNITGVLLLDIKAAFPSVARGRLIHAMKAKKIDGDLIRWTESFHSERTVKMVIEGNVVESHPVEAGLPQGSPVSPILFAIHTTALIKWVEVRAQAEGLSFVDDLGWVATGKDVNQVVERLEACAARSIKWASRWDLQFDTAKTEAALFTRNTGDKKHLRPKLTAEITVGNDFVRSNKEATWWRANWMYAHLTFKEHHNWCMQKARAAEARLHVLTKMHGIIPEGARAVQIACGQAVALYGCELWWDPKEIGRWEYLQLLLNRQARSTLGALPTTPMGALMKESGLTPTPVAVDARQQRFTARLTRTCEGSKLKAVHDHITSGAPICRVITKEHERGREAENMRWPNPDEEPAVKTVILSADIAAKTEAIGWAREREDKVGAGVWMRWMDGRDPMTPE